MTPAIPSWQHRTQLILGDEKLNQLRQAHVCVVGIGGVGASAAEALARAGIGEITLVDGDNVDPSNRNRQVVALSSTEGRSKVEIMKARILDINPECVVHARHIFLRDDATETLLDTRFDYIVDAIDSLSSKAYLIAGAVEKNIPIIVSLGSAGKLNPALIQEISLNQTHGCPLAKALRQRLKKINVDLSKVRTIFSEEIPVGTCEVTAPDDTMIYGKRSARGTISYLPPMFGLWAASVVIRTLSR